MLHQYERGFAVLSAGDIHTLRKLLRRPLLGGDENTGDCDDVEDEENTLDPNAHDRNGYTVRNRRKQYRTRFLHTHTLLPSLAY